MTQQNNFWTDAVFTFQLTRTGCCRVWLCQCCCTRRHSCPLHVFVGQIIMWWQVAGVFVPAAPGCLRWRQMESNSVENVTDHVLKVDGHEASAESKLGGDRSARGGLSRLHTVLCRAPQSCQRGVSKHTGLTLACLCFPTNKNNCVSLISQETVAKHRHVITTRKELQYSCTRVTNLWMSDFKGKFE